MEEAKSRVGSWDLKFVICNFVICKQKPAWLAALGTCQIPEVGTWDLTLLGRVNTPWSWSLAFGFWAVNDLARSEIPQQQQSAESWGSARHLGIWHMGFGSLARSRLGFCSVRSDVGIWHLAFGFGCSLDAQLRTP